MTHARRSSKALVLCLLFTAALAAADLISKDAAAAALPCDPTAQQDCRIIPGRAPNQAGGIEVVPGYLDFSYAENPGAAFGVLSTAPKPLRLGLFTITACGACLALLWTFSRGLFGPFYAWSVPFIVSGAVGNLIDRFRFGYVVDFIRFHIHDGWEYPTFNVADITIAIGAVLLLIDGFRGSASTRSANRQPSPEGQIG